MDATSPPNRPYIQKDEANTPSPRSLRIKKIEPHDYTTVQKTVDLWKKIAEEKKNRQPKTSRSFQNLVNIERLSTSLKISLPLFAQENNSNREVYICQDSDRTTQGILVLQVTSDAIEVDTLMTGPENIVSAKEERSPTQWAGIGTYLMEYVERRCRILKIPTIQLVPMPETTTFYVGKLHYEEEGAFGLFKKISIF